MLKKKKSKKKANLELPFRDKVGEKKEGEKKKREAVSIFIYSLNVYEFSRVSCHLDLTLGCPDLALIISFIIFFPFAH